MAILNKGRHFFKKMKTLIIGGKKGNIGGYLGKNVREETIVVCRSSEPSVDICNPEQVSQVIEKYRPDNIIITAGYYPKVDKLGKITDWENVSECIKIKTFGIINVLNFAVKYKVKKLIIVGGTEVSSDPRFCHFTIANGGLWSAVRFAVKHTKIKTYYLELGVVLNSPMGCSYINDTDCSGRNIIVNNSVGLKDILNATKDILDNKYKNGERIKVNKVSI